MGAQEHIRAEIDRLRVAAADMRQAAGGARHLSAIRTGEVDRMHGDAERALETGVIVSYARPFSKHGIGRLDPDLWTPAAPDDAKFHRALLRLRNIRYAHTDRTELRGTEDVFGDGTYAEFWVPLADDVWSEVERLADDLARGFDALAHELQSVMKNFGGE